MDIYYETSLKPLVYIIFIPKLRQPSLLIPNLHLLYSENPLVLPISISPAETIQITIAFLQHEVERLQALDLNQLHSNLLSTSGLILACDSQFQVPELIIPGFFLTLLIFEALADIQLEVSAPRQHLNLTLYELLNHLMVAEVLLDVELATLASDDHFLKLFLEFRFGGRDQLQLRVVFC